MRTRRLVAAVVLTVALGAVGTAQAQEGWYGGISFGSSNAELKEGLAPAAGATGFTIGRDERDPGYKVLLGYRLGRYFAVEGGYAHLGEFRLTRDVTAPTVGSVNADVRMKGLVIDAVGLLPMGERFSLFGKAGAFLSETKTFRATSGAATLPAGTGSSAIKDELNPKVGLGLQYDLGRAVTLRGEWERYWKVGDAQTGEQDVDLYSVGLKFRF
ncbi:MAG: outer membrane beta-barrel protein [Pseudomonadota bacterium]